MSGLGVRVETPLMTLPERDLRPEVKRRGYGYGPGFFEDGRIRYDNKLNGQDSSFDYDYTDSARLSTRGGNTVTVSVFEP